MAYRVEFTATASKQLRKLSATTAGRLIEAIEMLAVNPRPEKGVKQLKGKLKGLHRIRVGDYRVLYQIIDEQLVILVVELGNRKDIYD